MRESELNVKGDGEPETPKGWLYPKQKWVKSGRGMDLGEENNELILGPSGIEFKDMGP